MELICSYNTWGIVGINGKLYCIDCEDEAICEVKEVHRVVAAEISLYSEMELMDAPVEFDFSGEISNGDYVYWVKNI